MKNALVILAGGKGTRFSQKLPKQFFEIEGKSILNIFLSKLDFRLFDIVVISLDKKHISILKNSPEFIKNNKKIIISKPGATRQETSFEALKKIKNLGVRNVLIHDAARPFCTNKLLKKILSKLTKKDNCIPYIKYNDRIINRLNKKNNDVINIQTPQGFDFHLIFQAHKKFKNKKFSDDASLVQEMNKKIFFLKGENTNFKITHYEDLIYFNLFKKNRTRVGIGFDIHRINKKSKSGLKLCGIKLPFPKLVGHSDADVGLHAICDSIFGALSMRDIGYYFPNTEKKWKNADSSKFILYCRKKLVEKEYFITNLDINIIAEKPKISKYIKEMKNRISQLLKIKIEYISIKATTNEKIGFIGNGEGIASEAIVQISNENPN